ncbi:MAG: hypothetical protein JWO30_4563 [Fibrobacteres bacterium]|nr:hypothetical protein [Fibrobacterota bacterium]
MPMPSYSRHSVRGFFPLGHLAAALALCVCAGLSGCKTVEIDAPPVDTTHVTLDSATLRVTNKIDQDPDSITMILFPGNSVDISNANRVKTLGGVAHGATKVMKVPAGSWKLAYEDHAGVLVPMFDINDPAQDWLKSIFVKNGDYSLILTSDASFTKWDPTFATDPPIQ